LCIWAANGLYEVGLWTKASSAAAGWKLLARPAVSQCIVPGLIGLATIVSPIPGVSKRVYVFADSALPSRVDKEVGLWIAHQQDRPVKIMDLSIPLASHAGAQFTYFPYCTGDMALRYLDAAQVDYVVLRRDEKFTQYYEQWLTRGIPDYRAELVQPSSVAGADKFVIYRWHRDGVHAVRSSKRRKLSLRAYDAAESDSAPCGALKTLCLGCHSDDIEIGCGGTVLRLRDGTQAASFTGRYSAPLKFGKPRRNRGAEFFAGTNRTGGPQWARRGFLQPQNRAVKILRKLKVPNVADLYRLV